MSEIVQRNEAEAQVQAFSSGAAMVWSTYEGSDRDSKLAILNATQNAEPLRDHLGTPIDLVHFVMQPTTAIDDDGVEKDVIRTILIAANDDAYSVSSDGVVKALQNIVGVLGMPSTWSEPVRVVAEEAMSRRGRRFLTLRLSR